MRHATSDHDSLRAETSLAAPIEAAERVHELDALRGVALFGVFLLNMVTLAEPGLLATDTQIESLPTAHADAIALHLMEWLLRDKANTLFAFLFGLGFHMQMERLEARGPDAVRIYRRRLAVLLGFGIVHILFIWTGEILHLYALVGFALLALRKLKTRTFFVVGLILAMFGLLAQEALAELAGLNDWYRAVLPYSQEAALRRQALSAAGDYLGLMREFAQINLIDYVMNSAIVGWILYVLGRFMLGAWVGRHGWLQRATQYMKGFRRVLRWTLPLGLIIEGMASLMQLYVQEENSPWPLWMVSRGLHLLAVPLLATGYLCAIVVGLHTPLGHRLLSPFAYAGRMALTNYIVQSFFFGFVLFGVGPGLGLVGHIGTATVLLLVIAAYAVQVIVSRWWLVRFRHGPLEWIWRGLTYGQWPRFRSDPTA